MSRESSGKLAFRCNICGTACASLRSELERERPTCSLCGSTVRMRAMIHLLSHELFGASLALYDFPVRRDLRGIGLTDWEGYAIPLAEKLDYQNTYYHRDPFLDITRIDPELKGTLDFLIASDVFENVVPPVSLAFAGARELLKPEGVLIFSVPYTLDADTVEHFPELDDFEIGFVAGRCRLKNRTREGRIEYFDHLVFHGGGGNTLEMRLFSESGLSREFERAGFQITFHGEAHPEFGIYWDCNWSLPLAARVRSDPF